MNNTVLLNAVNEVCSDSFDLFERAFAECDIKHRFSRRHKSVMKAILKNTESPEKTRKKIRRGHNGLRRFAAIAAGIAIIGSLGAILYGEQLMYAFSDLIAPQNKRYDYLLSDGCYYLNGDRYSDIYFRVKDGTITLNGDRQELLNFYMNDEELSAGDREQITDFAEATVDRYLSGTKYAIIKTGEVHKYDDDMNELPMNMLEFAFVEEVDKMTEPWYVYIFINTEYSITFDGYKMIRLHPIGDFVLI